MQINGVGVLSIEGHVGLCLGPKMIPSKRKARENFYGYREIKDWRPGVIQLPDLNLVGLATSGKRGRKFVEELLDEVNQDKERICSTVKSQVTISSVPEKLWLLAIETLNRTFRADFIERFGDNKDDLCLAFCCGVRLGELDPNRRGESPVVALGLHEEVFESLNDDVFGKIAEIGSEEERNRSSARSVLIQRGFYLSRASRISY